MNNECGYLEGYFVDEVQGTNNYNDLNNLPTVNEVEIKGDLTLDDLGIQPKGNYALKDDIPAPYDDTQIKENIKELSEKVDSFETYDDTEIKKEIQDVNNKVDSIQEYDDTVIKQDIKDLQDNTGTSIDLSINNDNYVMTLDLKNSNGEVLSSKEVDLPLETMVVNAQYDSETKEIILTLQNGNTTRFSVADLVSGLASESDIPTKVSQLQNDSGYITGYTETDPTVPNYVKDITQQDITNWNNKLSSVPSNYVTDEQLNQVLGNINNVLSTLTTVEDGE